MKRPTDRRPASRRRSQRSGIVRERPESCRECGWIARRDEKAALANHFRKGTGPASDDGDTRRHGLNRDPAELLIPSGRGHGWDHYHVQFTIEVG